jgi:hypothetical protein
MKTIPLKDKQNVVVAKAICSAEDFDEISKHTWHRSIPDNDKCYASAKILNKRVKMHTFVLTLHSVTISSGSCVNHKNNNRLDNRFENLEVSTASENGQNKLKRGSAKSKYFGVSPKKGKYTAQITVNTVKVYIGLFDTENEAAEAYDRYVAHHDVKHKMNNEHLREKYKQEPLIFPKAKKDKYHGVFYRPEYNSYEVRTMINNKSKNIGSFSNEITAAKAYDGFVVKHGLNKKLNFPDVYSNYQPLLEIKTKIMKQEQDITYLKPSNSEEYILIDTEDYDRVKHFALCLNNGYPSVQINSSRHKLSRFIMKEKNPSIIIDHINNNKLDTRKCNLRRTTTQGNRENTGKIKKISTSKFYGVHKTKHGTWKCCVQHENKNVYHKTEKIEEHAARRYDLYILQNLKNTNKKLNFNWTEEDIQVWINLLN